MRRKDGSYGGEKRERSKRANDYNSKKEQIRKIDVERRNEEQKWRQKDKWVYKNEKMNAANEKANDNEKCISDSIETVVLPPPVL